MSEKTTGKKPVAEAEVTEEKKPVKTKQEGGKPVKEKKEGLFTRGKNWCKRNKKALLAGAAGVATGVAGTIGVAEIGKRQAERKARRNAYVPQEQEYSPLDPNV